MTKIACLLLRIYVRRENTQTGIQLCFNLVFTTASQKSHLNRILICFSLVLYCMYVPELFAIVSELLSGLNVSSPNLHCFHHEWGIITKNIKWKSTISKDISNTHYI